MDLIDNRCTADLSIDNRIRNNGEPGMGDINLRIKESALKDKTPMCLVNELARYNRITHQYHLTHAEGPPHKRKFWVTLKLGDFEYEAQGSSIKKAQHCAAGLALRSTKYQHPPPKLLPNNPVNISPTVELNALAMKLGKLVVYTTLRSPDQLASDLTSYIRPPNPTPLPSYNLFPPTHHFDYGFNKRVPTYPFAYPSQSNVRFLNNYAIPYNFVPVKQPYLVSVKVGSQEYFGEGLSLQKARHKAARLALNDLRNHDKMKENDNTYNDDKNKSPISDVHEKAYLHNLQATFEVIGESGPPHMRMFVTECKVGEMTARGEGNGKQQSKKQAAKKMLQLLETLPAPEVKTTCEQRKRALRKSTNFNRRKYQHINNDNGDGKKQIKQINQENSNNQRYEKSPIAKLAEYEKLKHGKKLVFTVIGEENNTDTKKMYSVKVAVTDNKCGTVGEGYTMRAAKNRAAIEMLKSLGIESDKLLSDVENEGSQDRKNEISTSVVNDKQLAPGILLVKQIDDKNRILPREDSLYIKESLQKICPKTSNNKDISAATAMEQLLDLVHQYNYTVQIIDFPKGYHHQKYLALLTIDTNPSKSFSGSGDNIEDAQNKAAYDALLIISQIGVETFFS